MKETAAPTDPTSMTNAQLLETHRALQEASEQTLPARQALQIGWALQATTRQVQPLQQMRQELAQRVRDEISERRRKRFVRIRCAPISSPG